MEPSFTNTIPVLPSSDIEKDAEWYRQKLGLEIHSADKMYAVLYRENLCIHLQWHAGTESDPLLGGSMVRVMVKNIDNLFNELVQRGAVSSNKFMRNTPWGTNEFGFFDLNKNALFFMEDIEGRAGS